MFKKLCNSLEQAIRYASGDSETPVENVTYFLDIKNFSLTSDQKKKIEDSIVKIKP